MSFWQQRLGVAPPPAAPAPAQDPASTRPWWLPGVAPQSVTAPVQQPQQTPVFVPGQAPQQASVSPDGQSNIVDLLHQQDYTTGRAESARDTESCPDCGSPNYMSPKGNPDAMKQCFNCGYNPRFAHSTAGVSGIGQGSNVAPPKAARVQRLTTNNYNPQGIIGRVTV